MPECSFERNKTRCTCTYDPCERKGRCCQCLAYHRKMKELPGCLFSTEGERSYDRSIRRFIAENK
ncbi:MAG: DUF6485 family protein [Thermodesulfobacteriota bacterium]